MFSLFVVFEGSAELGPVPIVRVSDDKLTRSVAGRALLTLSKRADALLLMDEAASVDVRHEVEALRAIINSM